VFEKAEAPDYPDVTVSPLLRLGRYETLFRLASGGMAEVYVACHRGEGDFLRVVAVKRMLRHLADEPGFVDMFLDEARLAASIRSPHVVQTLDVGRADDGSPFLVMELVVGVALSDLLTDTLRADTLIPVPVAAEILAQAAEGLHDAHEARSPAGGVLEIVHRDVSPQNILVGRDGRARMSDFGVARALHRRTTTVTGQLKGKFAYFSPEQARGQPLDRRSDVFALGIVAWELLALRRLFTSAEGAVGILDQVRSKPIPALTEVRADVPLGVAEVVGRALERNPDARFSTAAELAAALREASPGARPDEIARYLQSVSRARMERVEKSVEQALATFVDRPREDSLVPTAAARVGRGDSAGVSPKGSAALSPADSAEGPPDVTDTAPSMLGEATTEVATPMAGPPGQPVAPSPAPLLAQAGPRRNRWIGLAIVAGVVGLLGWASVSASGRNLFAGPTFGTEGAEATAVGARFANETDALRDGGVDANPCDRDHREGCEARCEAGEAEACYRHGESLALGSHGVRRDRPAGIDLLRRACDDGVGRACLLGSTILRQENQATPSEGWEAEYERMIVRGCELRFGNACRRLARELADGDVIPARPADALRFAELGCTYGDDHSCRLLADLYREGVGTPVDEMRAIEALSVACSRHDRIACSLLQRGAAPGE
jgi:serine/threonine-protein kinase